MGNSSGVGSGVGSTQSNRRRFGSSYLASISEASPVLNSSIIGLFFSIGFIFIDVIDTSIYGLH